MVGYHLMGEGHSIKLGSWGLGGGCDPGKQVQGSPGGA